MPKTSAGLLMFRQTPIAVEVFLVHPGGPFWARKDAGAWSLPKGEHGPDEAPLQAAQREFTEETGFIATGPFLPLGTVRQAGGKLVTAWAFAGDCDPAMLRSNLAAMVWPPRSGRTLQFPEIDRGAWFAPAAARAAILPSQAPFLDRLPSVLGDLSMVVA